MLSAEYSRRMKRFGGDGPDRSDNIELELTDGVSSRVRKQLSVSASI